MNYLLDTHVVLWLVGVRKKFRRPSLRRLEDPTNTLWISAISIWEIGVKEQLGKLKVPSDWSDCIRNWEAKELPVRWSHATRASGLPRHHSDPFDRMLIAQALCEEMTLVTDDETIQQYDLKTMQP